MRALLYPRFAVRSAALPPASFSEARIEHCPQGYVTPLSFSRGSAGGATLISVIVVKFLTVPLNRQIKV